MEREIALLRTKILSGSTESEILRPGSTPVMFSAPHCVIHSRQGQRKPNEPESGVLAELLHRELNCPIIRKADHREDDANFDQACSYKDSLIRYIREHRVGFLLDLHQMAWDQPTQICIGTGLGKNLSDPAFLRILEDSFREGGLDQVRIDEPFSGGRDYTVASTVHRECGIPTVQLEICSSLLRRRPPFESAYDFQKVFRCLCQCHDRLASALGENSPQP